MKVRLANQNDTPSITRLCGELGYPSSEEEIKERFGLIERSDDHAVFLAEEDSGTVIGWVHVLVFPCLEMEPATELGGLVVDPQFRGRGIGKLLMAEAERWSIGRGVKTLRFYSRMTREDAHRFYKRLGYEVIKSSYYFSKKLG